MNTIKDKFFEELIMLKNDGEYLEEFIVYINDTRKYLRTSYISPSEVIKRSQKELFLNRYHNHSLFFKVKHPFLFKLFCVEFKKYIYEVRYKYNELYYTDDKVAYIFSKEYYKFLIYLFDLKEMELDNIINICSKNEFIIPEYVNFIIKNFIKR